MEFEVNINMLDGANMKLNGIRYGRFDQASKSFVFIGNEIGQIKYIPEEKVKGISWVISEVEYAE